FCRLLGEVDVASAFEVKGIINYASRVLTIRHRVKSVMPVAVVRDVVEFVRQPSTSLTNLRAAALCVLGFAGFFRISDMLKIRREHIHISEHCATIEIERSKSDQFGVGDK